MSQDRRVGDWEPAAEASRRTARSRCGKERLTVFWIDVAQGAKLWITWGRGSRVRVDRSSRGPLLPPRGLIHSKPLNLSPLGPLLHRVVHRGEQGGTSGKDHVMRFWREWQQGSLAEAPRRLGSLRECVRCGIRPRERAPAWCRGPESNWGHRSFQGRALPAELPRRGHAGTTGFEPAISGVTIQRLRPDWTTSPYALASGQDRTRTCDLPDVSRMLSQLSYSPIIATLMDPARDPFWRPQGDLNPCRRDENPVSWATR